MIPKRKGSEDDEAMAGCGFLRRMACISRSPLAVADVGDLCTEYAVLSGAGAC
jgi:hypothetical protein